MLQIYGCESIGETWLLKKICLNVFFLKVFYGFSPGVDILSRVFLMCRSLLLKLHCVYCCAQSGVNCNIF